MSTHGTGIGIELDTHSIRAAKVKCTGPSAKATPSIAAIEEISGNFVKDEEIIEGLKALRQRLSVSMGDRTITCIGGKQTYAAQMSFRKLPEEELKTALKFEIRKNLPFDITGATIGYQFLNQNTKKNEPAPVIVTAVSNIILNRYLRLFEKANLPPAIIDVYPLTIANVYNLWSEQHKDADKNCILLHIGNDYSTLVIDGAYIPFFNRTVYFSASELFGPLRNEALVAREVERRIAAFSEEIVRSLAYYESTYHAKSSPSIAVIGEFNAPELLGKIAGDTGLTVTMLDLVKAFDAHRESVPGKFDIAITLGMRH